MTTMTTPATQTQSLTAIAIGHRLKIVKGCKARSLAAHVTVKVTDVAPLGAEYGYSVRVTFRTLTGMGPGKTFSFYARHVNRLSDRVIRMNDGIPSHVVEFVRA